VHHGGEIVRPCLHRGKLGEQNRVRKAGPSLVEDDEPPNRREFTKEPLEKRVLLLGLDVVVPVGEKDNVRAI
jgi:hypothetical protein